ncbi:MAG: hypothetical protein WC721_00365 [Victivallaceae bacterium]
MVMLAAWAKQSLLNGTPKCRSGLSRMCKVQELQKWRQLTKILTGDSIERGMRKFENGKTK